MINLSIIWVNYRTADLLLASMQSVVEHTQGITYELIVVDNASGDNLEEQLKIQHPTAKWVALPKNAGFGKANNAGVNVATGKNILFLNPDTLVTDNALKCLSDYLDEHPKVGVCGANLVDADGLPAHSFKRLLPSFWVELDAALKGVLMRMRYGKNTEYNHTGKPLSVAYICGADLMIRRAVWEKVGGFDPAIFMYYEDSLLCHHVKKQGYAIMSLPMARIVHLEGKSFTLHERREERIFQGRSIFFSKVYPCWYVACANALNRMLLRVGMVLARLQKKEEEYKKFSFRYHLYKSIKK